MSGRAVAALAAALMLAACGGSNDRAARRDGDTVSLNLGDGIGTVSADASGHGGFAGMGGTIGVSTDAPKLPNGLTLPAGSTVTSAITPRLPGMPASTIVEADSTATVSDVASHFRAAAKAAGLPIERDAPGEGEYVLTAGSGGASGFSVVIRPDGEGSSYVLTAAAPAP